jgi:hypothetical protein
VTKNHQSSTAKWTSGAGWSLVGSFKIFLLLILWKKHALIGLKLYRCIKNGECIFIFTGWRENFFTVHQWAKMLAKLCSQPNIYKLYVYFQWCYIHTPRGQQSTLLPKGCVNIAIIETFTLFLAYEQCQLYRALIYITIGQSL